MAVSLPIHWPYPTALVTEWPGASSLVTRPNHYGTDFGVAQGTPVPATIDGNVVWAGDDGLGAWCIELRRDDGLIVRFGHLSRIDVRAGQRVSAAQKIGLSGGAQGTPGAGNSTGPHLHWELRWDRLWSGGAWVDPRTLNPLDPGASQEEDDMYSDADRKRDAVVAKQTAEIHWMLDKRIRPQLDKIEGITNGEDWGLRHLIGETRRELGAVAEKVGVEDAHAEHPGTKK